MLTNLICSNNYNQYNISLARIIGLVESAYVNELLNISFQEACDNKNFNGYFSVSRSKIFDRTTIVVEEQYNIDKTLSSIGIINIGETKDILKIDEDRIISLLCATDEKVIKNIYSEVKQTKKVNKAEIIRQQLKKNIQTNNEELRAAYSEWIDSVSMKRGYMAKKAVLEGQSNLDNYCKDNLDMALKILSIATIQSYPDITWAINDFKKDYLKTFSNNNTKIIQSVQQLSNQVF